MSSKVTFASVIKNRGFLNLWVNQILVQFSYNCLNFALIIWVFRLTDSNMAVSALMLSIYLPAVLFGLFSGVLVDITDRKIVIRSINFVLCLLVLSLIFLKMNIVAVLLTAFCINTLVQFYGTAEISAIPLIVNRSQLILANSLFTTTLFISFLLGFGLAGPLISRLGIDQLFILASFLLFLAFLLSLLFPSVKAASNKQGQLLISALANKDISVIRAIGMQEIVRTLRMIRGKLPILSSIGILAGVQVVVGIIAVLAPGFLEKTLKIEATDASYIVILPLGLGLMTGGFILGKLGNRFVRRALVSKAILFAGSLFFLEGISPIISPAIRYFHTKRPLSFITQPPLSSVIIAGSFLMGMALVSIMVPSQTVLQENTTEKDRGKVFAVLGVAMSGLSLLPVLLSGFLADLFGTTPIFISLGLVIIILGLFGLKPNLFFSKKSLPFKVREFLGLGHWEKKV